MNKTTYRKQRVCEPCFLTYNTVDNKVCNVPLYFNKILFWFWKDGVKMCQIVSSVQRVIEMVTEFEKRGLGAFASAPIPCFGGQHGIIAVSCAGETHDVFFSKFYAGIKKGHDSVLGIVTTEPSKKEMPVQVIKKQEEKDALDWLDSL